MEQIVNGFENLVEIIANSNENYYIEEADDLGNDWEYVWIKWNGKKNPVKYIATGITLCEVYRLIPKICLTCGWQGNDSDSNWCNNIKNSALYNFQTPLADTFGCNNWEKNK
jgi:hypothetical protein